MKKQICILGSTGSIGTQALDVISQHPDRYEAYCLTANNRYEMLAEQARKYRPAAVVIANEQHYEALKELLSDMPDIKIYAGHKALDEIVEAQPIDMVLTAMVGFAGLSPTIHAIKARKTICLANKETLVVAGALICRLAAEHRVNILPVDSEHSAIFQSIVGEGSNEIEKILLTASGGPFRRFTLDQMRGVKAADALKHPTWDMGAKITIDSASMMNKGLEIIEAHHLYGLPLERIGVLVHPQSLVHSLVEFEDGSLMAQAGTPDMRMPIAYCLAWPLCLDAGVPPLDLARSGALTFEEPDLHSFPCLELACRTIGKGSALPVALNAANEVAVEAFLSGRIGFMDIPDIIGRALDECSAPDPASLEAIETLDHETRLRVGLWIEKV